MHYAPHPRLVVPDRSTDSGRLSPTPSDPARGRPTPLEKFPPARRVREPHLRQGVSWQQQLTWEVGPLHPPTSTTMELEAQ